MKRNNKKRLILARDKNLKAQIGTECKCPSCYTRFIKESYQQVFCKSKPKTQCKDFYWNNVTPNKRCNTTRISPANAAYRQNVISQRCRSDIFNEDTDDDDIGHYDEGDDEYWKNKDY